MGLGNPGFDYAHHRHNVGFMVADSLGNSWVSNREALCCNMRVVGTPVLLIKPQTFMNDSGRAVAFNAFLDEENLAKIIVIHDDLDLPFGTIRIKVGGSDGGHRGIRSIIDCLTFQDFIRVKLGIGRPPKGTSILKHVLSPFLPEEQETLNNLVDKGKSAVELIVREGVSIAQNALNNTG